MAKTIGDSLRECDDRQLAVKLIDMVYNTFEMAGLGMLLDFVDYEEEVNAMVELLGQEYKAASDYLS